MPNHVTNILTFACSDERFKEVVMFLKGNDPDAKPGTIDFNTLIPMPAELKIESGTRGDEGLQMYRAFLEEYGNNPTAEVEASYKNALVKNEVAQREERNSPYADIDKVREDINEIWELGKQYYHNLQKHGATTWYDWAWNHWGTKWNAYECEMHESAHEIRFFTAWNGVPALMQTLSERLPDIEIDYRYASEDFGYEVGHIRYKDGEIIGGVIPDGGDKEAIELAASIMDTTPAQMGYRLMPNNTYEFDETLFEED